MPQRDRKEKDEITEESLLGRGDIPSIAARAFNKLKELKEQKQQVDRWVTETEPKESDEFHDFSNRPNTVGVERPWVIARDKAAAAKLDEPIFPKGKARYPRTELRQPELGLDAKGNPTVVPSALGNQYLQRVPGGVEAFVAEQKKNFEQARMGSTDPGYEGGRSGFEQIKDPKGGVMLDPDAAGLRAETLRRMASTPPPNLIDFELRDTPVSMKEIGTVSPRLYVKDRVIGGVDPESNERLPTERIPTSKEEVALRRFNALPPAGPINPQTMRDTMSHEANHSYLNVSRKKPPEGSYEGVPHFESAEEQAVKGVNSYQTTNDFEWAQGVTAGLNGMRDITGLKLNNAREVHKLLDEVEGNPKILENLSDENARIFRSYIKVNKENPRSGKRMRESIVRDAHYLVEKDKEAEPEDFMASVDRSFRSIG